MFFLCFTVKCVNYFATLKYIKIHQNEFGGRALPPGPAWKAYNARLLMRLNWITAMQMKTDNDRKKMGKIRKKIQVEAPQDGSR